jgi:NO-binding membrane sensor protein with MHYT domain
MSLVYIFFGYKFWALHFVGCLLERKSTSVTCQFLGTSLVSWSSQKQSSVAMSTTEAEILLPLAIARSYFG